MDLYIKAAHGGENTCYGISFHKPDRRPAFISAYLGEKKEENGFICFQMTESLMSPAAARVELPGRATKAAKLAAFRQLLDTMARDGLINKQPVPSV
jgi:hypothetical protein